MTAPKQPLVLVGLVIAALFLWQIVDVLLLVFAAILGATVLLVLSEAIEEHTPVPGRAALALAVSLVIAVFALAAWLFGNEVSSQVSQLRKAIPESWDTLQKQLGEHAWFEAIQDRLDSQFGGMRGILSSLQWMATSLLAVVLNLVLIIFGAIYIAAQPNLYRRGMLALVPPRLRERAADALDACGGALRLWLLGQLISMVAVGLLTGLGLWLVGVPSAFALGLLAGLAEFVPYVGPLISAVPGLLVALSVSPELVLWALLVYLVVQQLENNLIMPIVQRKAVTLPPALTVFAVIAMSVVFGALGLLFATPLTVVAFVLTKKLYIEETLHEETTIPGEEPQRRTA